MLVVLLVAVAVPAGCVLWFMTAAMRNESLAVRQRLADVYRDKMLAARQELDDAWKEQLAVLGRSHGDKSPASLFAAFVRQGVAESVVLFDSKHKRVYPVDLAAERTPTPDGDALWDEAVQLEQQDGRLADAARAYADLAAKTKSADYQAQTLRAQARCLLRSGDKEAAVAVLVGLIARDDLRRAVDSSGRAIVPAAELLALRLMADAQDGRSEAIRSRLIKQLRDYAVSMSASQRRFLMRMLVESGQPASTLDTLAAEDLAAEYLAVEQPEPESERLSRSKAPGLWHIRQGDRIGLYRQQWIVRHLEPLLARHAATGMSLVLRPAESRSSDVQPILSMWATDYLPGWRLETRLTGPDPFAAAAGRQRDVYLWTGGLGVVLIAALALTVAGFVSRQMRLTRLKNDLIATVSHELKTPLASMRMLVDTLLEGRYRDQRQVEEYLGLIARENQRLSRLIDNFLTFSRMERNKQAYASAPVRVREIVDTAVAAVGERFRGPGCRLDVTVPDDLPELTGDRDALTTVVVNLLDNAWKYTGDEKHVIVRGYQQDGQIVLEVQDNGVGIPRRAQRRIFNRFYQVDRSLSRRAGGCGLGLSIVRFIVAAHGGTVTASSEPGKGSVFRVTLPIRPGGWRGSAEDGV